MDRTPADICLVLMPYAAVERPSIALGLLKASLAGKPYSSRVLYANFWFAEAIGLRFYKLLETSVGLDVLGEWTFSGSAFPDFHPDHKAYLERAKASLIFSARGHWFEGKDFDQELFAIREKAEAFVDEVACRVLEHEPKLVGCSSVFQQHLASLALLKRIHELAPEVVTVIGGANCEGPMGIATRQLFPWVDFVVSGEADLLFPELCALALEKGRDVSAQELPYGVLGDQSGVNALDNSGTTIPRTILQDMDQCPIPDYDDYFRELKESALDRYITPGLLIETSRGCWWGAKHHCTFCGLNGYGMEYRSKSPDRVIAEFRSLSEKYGLNRFEVVDNILDMKYFNTVLPALKESGPYEIFFETKANLKYKEMKELAASGIRAIQPGMESMHNSILKLLDKGNTTWINIQVLKWARELGMRINWLFLVMIPAEKDEWYREMSEFLPLLSHLPPPVGITRIQYHRFSPYHQRPADFGLDLTPAQMYRFVYPFSEEQLSGLAYFFEDRNNMRPLPGPGMAAFLREEVVWVRSWNTGIDFWTRRMNPVFDFGSPEPVLIMKEEGDDLLIEDTRDCAVESEHLLAGLAAQIYITCETAMTTGSLLDALPKETTLESIEPIVADLLNRKLMIKLEDRYLSLACRARGEIPISWPGGEVRFPDQESFDDLFLAHES